MNHQNLEKKEKLLITTALEGLPDKGFEKIIFLLTELVVEGRYAILEKLHK